MYIPVISILSLLLVTVNAANPAKKCDNTVAATCTIDKNCRCSSTLSPLKEGTAPQLIALTFEESVVEDVFLNLWAPILFNRTNADGSAISGTFFVPHEYTDYKRVQDLYVQGFEIGVNSITKNSLVQYWSNASEATLVQEFQGQRVIISTFANIPIEDIVGARTPQLQLQGDTSINAYVDSEILYDNSWTTRSSSLYFPYTLDYQSTQECRTGTTCPVDEWPGFWIVPIIDLQGNSSTNNTLECTALTGCFLQGTANDITQWLLSQVERERSTTRAPLTLLIPSAWFRITDNSVEGFTKFLDTLKTYNDVFLVSVKQIIDWIDDPVPLEQYSIPPLERESDCLNINCPLNNTQGDIRYMRSCIPCPATYPWLGNPTGDVN